MATGSEDTSLKVLDTYKMRAGGGGDSSEDRPLIRTFYDHVEVRSKKLHFIRKIAQIPTFLVQAVNEVAFHPNGKVLASCSDDCTIKIYDLLRVGVKRAFRFLQVPI